MTAAISLPRAAKSAFERAAIVVGKRERRLRAIARGTPAESGTPNVARAAARFHEQVVGVPVVAALELDDDVAPA